MLSQNIEEYLEAIYKLSGEGEPAAIPALAERLGVTGVAANEMTRKLAKEGLVTYQPYKGVSLTPGGEAQALTVVRRHRLWERFLVDVLEMPWEEAHQEACGLEHASSPDLIDRLAAFLGTPDTCPHGHAVPSVTGEVAEEAGTPLSALTAGQTATVLRVPEDEPGMLTYLNQLGLRPDAEVSVEEVAPFDGPVTVRVDGEHHALGRGLASRIVVRMPGAPMPPASQRIPAGDKTGRSLYSLQVGQSGRVVELRGGHGFATRMAALGFTPGAEIHIVQNFGRGPIIVMVRGTRIALGKGEADQVRVKERGDYSDAAA